ncbi:MAG TPA: hypothetical protein VFW42_02535 [Fluviicoccus sp.]|nr:hypothetical protein [Fluviicoccus sp.]
MQGSVKTAGRVLLTGALAALAGCGGGDIPEVESTYVRLQEIRHYSVNTSGVQTQLWRQHFSYLDKSTPDKMVYYNGKGADAAWNTADDSVAYYVACAYSGKAATAPLDLESEIANGLDYVYSNYGADMTGLDRASLARSCAVNYNGQGALVMKVYKDPGADAKWQSADDVQLLGVNWQQPGTAGDSSVAVSAPGIAGSGTATTAHYYYSASGGAVRYLVRQTYYKRYEFDTANRPTRISSYTYIGVPTAPWGGTQASHVRQEYTDYEYGPADLVKCRRDLMGNPVEAVRDAFVDGLLNERQYFDAGLDGTPCTGDDAVTAVEKFVFEKI